MRNVTEVALVFLKLGTTAFGGPAAHIAMMDEEIVKRRGWVDRESFLDMLGTANLIPGPNSTELAIHIGYKRAGWPGLLAAGICFIAPAMLIVWLLAWLYVRYGTLPELTGVLYGIKPVIVAVVAQALWSLARTAVKSRTTLALGVAALAAVALGANELPVLLAAGFIGAALSGRIAPGGAASFAPWPAMAAAAAAAEPSALKPAGLSLAALFFTFLKIGSVLYGSGYVLIAYLQADFVDRTAALTAGQLMDAVAVGQFTPGPLFTTATFVGYLVHGGPGALAATAGIFLPAFVFIALIGRWAARLRSHPRTSGFLDGVNVASLAMMTAVSGKLAVSSVVDWTTGALAAAAFLVLVRYKWNSAWLVLAGGIAGWAATAASGG
ncbi:chromate efflux transporter [Paenibacillus flagellatus]|uniref:Chromate transporter n=1 Tax=Paenibacillus flagellatus TaxID=2211139 RepID=A0A2V5KS83_9BACL|nr:chromate efflux transporter [Paenibacillus flagellatus]PYI54437.1 chromate transporter [Paenibacillus flagellatus]